MRRLWRILRSRRAALWLIVLLSAYAAVATSVPQKAISPGEHAQWAGSTSPLVGLARALGMDHAYTSPIFLALAFALATSTAVCAWERATGAKRIWRGRGRVGEAVRSRLRERPDVCFVTSEPAQEVLERAAHALEALGLRVRRGPVVTYAERDAWGLLGSPLFHWSIVVLVVVVALGQLTRWEGLIGVSEFGAVTERAESYGRLDEGPWALPHTGFEIAVPEVREQMRVRGVEYGVTPAVALRRDGRVVAQQLVYANNPLRYGPLLVHLSDHGLAVRIEVTGPDGSSRGTSDRLIDFSDEASSGTTPSGFLVSDDAGKPLADVSVWVEARDRAGALPRLKPPGDVIVLELTTPDGRVTKRKVAVGASVALRDGYALSVRDFGYYARLSVVRDWSVDWVYAMLGLMTFGVTVALLAPYRCVWVTVRDEGGRPKLCASVVHARRDPLFMESVRSALSDACGAIDTLS